MGATLEAVKQFGRVVLVAVIPIVVSGLQTNSIDIRLIVITGVTALLMALDKWIHESDMKAGGIVPF